MNTNLEISNHNSNIFVYSTNGNLVLTKKVDGFVVIDGLKKGTYIIKIVNQDDIIVKKLIIE